MTTRTWPDREEWAANAEHAVITRCLPHERVSTSPEDWLSTTELAELQSLIPLVVKVARRHINRLIRTLATEFADEPKGAGWYDWNDALTDDQRDRRNQLGRFRDDRSSLNHGARRASSAYADVDDAVQGLGSVVYAAKTYVTEECPAADRLGELVAALRERRDTAAEKATEEAVRREVAKRNSDEGWAKELERRANFTTGVVIRDGRLV